MERPLNDIERVNSRHLTSRPARCLTFHQRRPARQTKFTRLRTMKIRYHVTVMSERIRRVEMSELQIVAVKNVTIFGGEIAVACR